MDDTLPRQLAREIEDKGGRSDGASETTMETVPCDICGSERSTPLFRTRETRTWWHAKCDDDPRLDRDYDFSVVRCGDFRHVFVNPRLKRAINGG